MLYEEILKHIQKKFPLTEIRMDGINSYLVYNDASVIDKISGNLTIIKTTKYENWIQFDLNQPDSISKIEQAVGDRILEIDQRRIDATRVKSVNDFRKFLNHEQF